MCRIQDVKAEDDGFGTGFLCELQVKDRLRYGLVTNHHVLPNTDSYYLQHVKVLFKEIEGEWNEFFYLSCENIGDLRESYSDIDAAFIELSEQFQNQLRKSERKFLETDTTMNEGNTILVVQYPTQQSALISGLSTGKILDSRLEWDLPPGCELHSAFTLPGNSGSPVFINGKVFGIHMGSSQYSKQNTFVRIQFLIEKLNGKTVEEIVSTGVLR